MLKSMIALAIAVATSVPAAAQTASQADQPQAAKPQTVKKKVCTRVDNEETTGSRLGSAPMVCKMVEVPAPQGGVASSQEAPAAAQTGNNL